MRYLLVWLLLVTAAYGVTIRNDHGGLISDYSNHMSDLISSRQRVVVDGACYSACTMVLGVPGMCVTPRAVFGFHSAYLEDGHHTLAPEGNVVLEQYYPPAVRDWIARHGGLQRNIITLQGAEMLAILPHCK